MGWKVSTGVRDLILECRRSGMKYREISDKSGVSISTAWNVVKYGSNYNANEVYAKRINGYKSYREYKRNWLIKRKWEENDFWQNLGNDIY